MRLSCMHKIKMYVHLPFENTKAKNVVLNSGNTGNLCLKLRTTEIFDPETQYEYGKTRLSNLQQKPLMRL